MVLGNLAGDETTTAPCRLIATSVPIRNAVRVRRGWFRGGRLLTVAVATVATLGLPACSADPQRSSRDTPTGWASASDSATDPADGWTVFGSAPDCAGDQVITADLPSPNAWSALDPCRVVGLVGADLYLLGESQRYLLQGSVVPEGAEVQNVVVTSKQVWLSGLDAEGKAFLLSVDADGVHGSELPADAASIGGLTRDGDGVLVALSGSRGGQLGKTGKPGGAVRGRRLPIDPVAVSREDRLIAVAGVGKGRAEVLVGSGDGRWRRTTLPPESDVVAISVSDGVVAVAVNRLAAGAPESVRIFTSSDEGTTWSRQTVPGRGYASDLAAGAEGELFGAFGGANRAPVLLRRTGGPGAAWRAYGSIPPSEQTPVIDIAGGTVWVMTDRLTGMIDPKE